MNNNEWISVKDSLPEKAGVYTVLTADGKECDEVFMDLVGNGKKIFLRQNVTHWKEITRTQ